MLKTLIVDDEKGSKEVLKQLLGDFCPAIKIVGEVASAQTAYDFILGNQIDLVFLDIQMPTGNGFTMLQKFEVLPFNVIFVTGYDQYAINAIKFSALDYLLKPVAIDLLKDAVRRAEISHERKSNQHRQMINLLQLVNPEVVEKKIALHHHDNVRLVKITDVISIEGQSNYAEITMLNGERYTSSRTLKEFEEYLNNYNFFIRIHKMVIINTNHISKYSKGDPFIIEMCNKIEFEASRRRKHDVLARLK